MSKSRVLAQEPSVAEQSQPEVRLKIVVDHLIQLTMARESLNRLQRSTHGYVVSFDLGNNILVETPSARANSVAEVTNPAAVVFAHVKVVVVAQLQTGVTKLAIALVLWLLAQLKVSAQIHVPVFLSIQLQ